ncbi:MAG TPA: hypothetical protein VLL77_03450 [Anaerolineales bacterium]|nr:hypothetical protein [Anaerolineales bacterium]
MIQVRETYQVRFGRMDQAIDYWSRLPKEVAEWPDDRAEYEVLTDLSGEMFTLVVARHVDSVEAWQAAMGRLQVDPAYQEWFRSFKQFAENGRREFLMVDQPNRGWSGRGAIVVRSCFQALEWRVAEALDLTKAYGALLVDQGVGERPRVLSDLSGSMFNVMIEIETRDLKNWDDHRRTMFRDAQFQVWFRRLTACVSHGSHDFLTVAGPA